MGNSNRSQERSPTNQTSENKNESDEDLKISFRLKADYSAKLRSMSQVARTSHNQIARQLLVTVLENPHPHELVQDLHEVGVNIEFLLAETHRLSREVASLKVALAASIELILTIAGGITPDDARLVIDELFQGEEV